ncbi:MAG: glycosyltransferase and protein [Gemmatimonadetes bacterium]|nr:glycosyltransferase and protein [Gemmatimonadota bacterium]
MTLILGANAFAAKGEGARRQSEALATWRALEGVELVNLQWPDELFELDGFETHAVLETDSRTVTGKAGRRLPILREVFDRLAAIAEQKGARWFAFANSDVGIRQAGIDRVLRGDKEGYAFCRMDTEAGTGREIAMVTAGIDIFALRTDWWRANRHRFRDYIVGETIWDNVYASLLLSHADAVLLNRETLITHEFHQPADWGNSPFAPYLNDLAARDRTYFTRWVEYYQALTAMRERAGGMADEAEELQLQRDVFHPSHSMRERLVQALRMLKWSAKRRLR